MDEKLDVSNLDENCLSLEEDCCPVNTEGESGYFSAISLQQSVKDGYNSSLQEWPYSDLSLSHPSVTGDDFHSRSSHSSFRPRETRDTPVSPGISQPLQSLDLSRGQCHHSLGHGPLGHGRTEEEGTRLNYPKKTNNSQLLEALWQNQTERAASLIRNIADDDRERLNLPNGNLQTVLHVATLLKMVEIVHLLVKEKADITQCDNRGETPLHIACREGYIEIIKVIHSNANRQTVLGSLEARNFEGLNCLHLAAVNLHFDMVKLLANIGVDVNAKDGMYHFTILHYAVEKNSEELLECVLNLENISLTETSYSGETALQLAEKYRYCGLTKMLREHFSSYSPE